MTISTQLMWFSAFMFAFVGVFGLLIGSFLNVVVYRVPAGLSVVRPASSCPNCGSPIRGYDNIPVVSWLVLRGRCRDCRTPISVRYPLVELATGAFFALVAWRFWPAGEGIRFIGGAVLLLALLYLAAISVALAAIDLDTRRLPNALVLPSYVVGAVLLTLAALFGGDPTRLITGGIGMAALFLFYLVAALAYPGGMGFGDVKLAGVIGLFLGFLGWQQLVVGAFAAFLLGGLYAIILLVRSRAGRRSGIPFGPWMLAGAWVGAFVGAPLIDAYLSAFGLTL